MSTDVAVELRGITKRFPGVVANHDVSLTVHTGTIHAIIGENGAGKSTLMKILYGMLRPDAGTITIHGQLRTTHTPHHAITAGIGMVHQHFMLADNLTVAENIVLGAEHHHGIGARAQAAIRDLSTRYGLDLDPTQTVADLTVGQRQRVEICKALYRGARILILDEPTAVLVPHEVDTLFTNLRHLTTDGLTVIFISHKLGEILTLADAITVIRHGTTITTITNPAATTPHHLATLMIGADLPTPPPRPTPTHGPPALTVRHLTVTTPDSRPIIDNLNLDLHHGQILGIAGVDGNGQTELVEALLGLRPATATTITLDDTDLTHTTTRARREAGLGHIPDDRHRHGLLLDAPLWENRMLGHQTQPPNARGWRLTPTLARADTTTLITDHDIRTPNPDIPAAALSGGNQQKLIIGRELRHHPTVLLAAHPTRGVDIGAQAAIWHHLHTARDHGMAILLISADLDELLTHADTLKVIYRGQLTTTLNPATTTPEQLGLAMTGQVAS